MRRFRWTRTMGNILVAGATVYDNAVDAPNILRRVLQEEWIDRIVAGDDIDDIVNDLIQSGGSLQPGIAIIDDGVVDKVTALVTRNSSFSCSYGS